MKNTIAVGELDRGQPATKLGIARLADLRQGRCLSTADLCLCFVLCVANGCATTTNPNTSATLAPVTQSADWLGNVALLVEVWPSQIARRAAPSLESKTDAPTGSSGELQSLWPPNTPGDLVAVPVALSLGALEAMVRPGVDAARTKLAENEQRALENFKRAIVDIDFERTFKTHLLKRIQERHPRSVMLESVPALPMKGELLQDERRIDTLLAVEVIDASLRESQLRNTHLMFWYTSLRLTVQLRFKITRVADGQELDSDQLTFRSEPRTFAGWTDKNAQRLREALERGHRHLGDQIVQRLFLPPANNREH